MSAVLQTENLAKTFILWEKGLVRKKIRAVESISLSVEQNDDLWKAVLFIKNSNQMKDAPAAKPAGQ